MSVASPSFMELWMGSNLVPVIDLLYSAWIGSISVLPAQRGALTAG